MSHHSGMVATCWATGKKGYDTRKRAKAAANRTAAKYGEHRLDWNAYRCEDCNLWHAGHRRAVDRG